MIRQHGLVVIRRARTKVAAASAAAAVAAAAASRLCNHVDAFCMATAKRRSTRDVISHVTSVLRPTE